MKSKKFVLKWSKKPDYRKSFVSKPNSKLLKHLERMLLEEPKSLVLSKKRPGNRQPITYARFRARTFRNKRPFRKSTASLNRIFFRRFTKKFRRQNISVFRQIFGFETDNLDALSFSRWFNRFFYKRHRILAFRFFHIIRKLKKYKYLVRRRGIKKFFSFTRDFRLKYRNFAVKVITRSAPTFFRSKRRLIKRFNRVERIRPFFARKSKRLKASKLAYTFSAAAYNFFTLRRPLVAVADQAKSRQTSFSYFFNELQLPVVGVTEDNNLLGSYRLSASVNTGGQPLGFSSNLQNLSANLRLSRRASNPLRYFFTNSHRRSPFKFFQPNRAFTRSSKLTATALFALRRKKLSFYRRKFAASYTKYRLANKLHFSLTQQTKKFGIKNPSQKFFSRKKFLRFKPFLGVFDRYGRARYKLKRRRLKFFSFFKRYFKRFRAYSGSYKNKFRDVSRNTFAIKHYLHVFRSVNNLFVNVSTPRGRSIYVYSAGRTPYRGSKRLSPIAIETMGKNVSEILKNSEVFNIFVVFHSPVDFLSRALLRGLRAYVQFSGFRYHLNRPHNGLRKRASRRV